MCVGMCVCMRVDMCVGLCVGMRVGMCIGMCVDMCVGMCVEVCVGACIDMCADMRIGMCIVSMHMSIHMCIDMRTGMCIDMCIARPAALRMRSSLMMSPWLPWSRSATTAPSSAAAALLGLTGTTHLVHGYELSQKCSCCSFVPQQGTSLPPFLPMMNPSRSRPLFLPVYLAPVTNIEWSIITVNNSGSAT